MRILLAIFAAALADPSALAQASFTESFGGTTVDARLVTRTLPGFHADLVNGRLAVSKDPGVTAPAAARLLDSLVATGDFNATVDLDQLNLAGNASLGIATTHEFGFTDVFFIGNGSLYSNIFVSPGFGTQWTNVAAAATTLRIRRAGNTLYEEFDQGSGFVTLHSATHPNLAGPVRVSLFLLNEFGSTAAQSATFDNFSIQAAAFACNGQNVPYGAGTQGTGGIVPRVDSACLYPGLPMSFDVADGVGGGFAILALGFQPTSQPLLGGTLLVGAPTFAFVMLLGGASGIAGAGDATLTLPLPFDSGWFGASLFLQAGVLDAQAAQGVAFTAGLEARFPNW